MTIKLPVKKGEKISIWEGFEKDSEGPSRISVICDSVGSWSMVTESSYPNEDGELWSDGEKYVWDSVGGIGVESIRKMFVSMLMSLREYLSASLIPSVEPEHPSFLKYGENIISKVGGNKCLIINNMDSDFHGNPILEIYTNKPMNSGEWLAALENLAKSIDNHDNKYK